MLNFGFHSWLYRNCHWFYKWLSGYAYPFNVQCEELKQEIQKQISLCEENVKC